MVNINRCPGCWHKIGIEAWSAGAGIYFHFGLMWVSLRWDTKGGWWLLDLGPLSFYRRVKAHDTHDNNQTPVA